VSYTVGSVPYVNAIPLVAMFEQCEDSPVRVLYDVPSRLPMLLDAGQADAVLVSSVDALRVPGRRMAERVCIGSQGRVKSVRLFSKVQPRDIKSLALDQSSMTSNRLAQVILRERYGASPRAEERPPHQKQMLDEFDACVLIGDIGMTATSEGLQVLDLGEQWQRLTGKPFVWAAWMGGANLTPSLARHLCIAANYYKVGQRPLRQAVGALTPEPGATNQDSEGRQREIIELARQRSGWDEATLRDYFMNAMLYDMSEDALDGLREFQRLLLKHGFEDCRFFPQLVPTD
jgi:chorismate dehydratase